MINLILALILLFLLYFSAILSRSIFGRNLWVLSPVMALIGYFFLRDFFGVIYSSYKLESFRPLLANVFFFFGVLSALIIVSFVCSGKSLVARGTLRERWAGSQNTQDGSIVYFFIFIGLFSLVFTYVMFGRVPLFYLFQGLLGGGAEYGMHEARQMNTHTHASGDVAYFGQGYLKVLYTVVAPFYLLYFYIKNAPLGLRGKLFFYSFVLVFVVGAAANGQIWVPVNVVLLFFMGYIFNKASEGGKGYEWRILKIALIAYTSLIVMLFLYRYAQYLGGRAMPEGVIANLIGRIYDLPAAKLYLIFPEEQGFRWGATWLNNLSGFLPGAVESFSYEVHNLVYGGRWGYTLAPSMTGSAYVNFGYAGSYGFGLFVTLVYTLTAYSFFKQGSSFRVALAVLLSHGFALSFSADINVYATNYITIFMLYWTYRLAVSFLYLFAGNAKVSAYGK